MMTVKPLETSVRDLAPDTLVYVIRDGWALAYRAEMLDDRANELYVADVLLPTACDSPEPCPMCWTNSLSVTYLVGTSFTVMERAMWVCAAHTLREPEFRARYGRPVDKVQHPR